MNAPRSGKPVRVGDLEIEPIERVIVRVESIGGGIVGVALKEPLAIIVRSPAGAWRVDLESLARTGIDDRDTEL